ILIAGGTNTGKTTLANALLKEITDLFPTERLVILEDTVELQCVAPDHLALRTSPTVTLAHLVKSALRTSPTRIVVGEVRGSEALDLLDAWATGHPGGVATVHASSPEGALLRLDRLAFVVGGALWACTRHEEGARRVAQAVVGLAIMIGAANIVSALAFVGATV